MIPIEFDLSRNELHLDPLPQVRAVLESSASTLNRYPQDHHLATLMEQIGELHGVPAGHVVVGPGSVGVLDALLHTRLQRGRSTLFATPTFSEYEVLTARAGGIPVGIPGDQSPEALIPHVDASTQQVIITAPHNPTGATASLDALVAIREALPDNVLLVIDQAYAEFDETLPADAVRRVTACGDVAVLRSFSKAYGLAGLRIGYGVFSGTGQAERVRAAIPVFSVNSVGARAACESLRHQDQLRQRVARVIENRKCLEDFLIRHDMFCGIASQGNFVWVPTANSRALHERARANGVLLREYPGEGVRITVQSEASVDALIGSLAGAHA